MVRVLGIDSPLKMGELSCPESSVNNDKSTLCNIPEEPRSRFLACFLPKSEYHITALSQNIIIIFEFLLSSLRIYVERGGVVVKALHYKLAGGGLDSLWCHWNFSVT
jgi:hypothetical protein